MSGSVNLNSAAAAPSKIVAEVKRKLAPSIFDRVKGIFGDVGQKITKAIHKSPAVSTKSAEDIMSEFEVVPGLAELKSALESQYTSFHSMQPSEIQEFCNELRDFMSGSSQQFEVFEEITQKVVELHYGDQEGVQAAAENCLIQIAAGLNVSWLDQTLDESLRSIKIQVALQRILSS
jgi:DNA-directed RNA polymerase subunit F